MASPDPVADFLTCIRNANQRFLDRFDIPSSRVKFAIAQVLKDEGYLANCKIIPDHRQGILRVYMRYVTDSQNGEKKQVIQKIQRVSHCGRRVYRKREELLSIRRGLGMAIVSTSQGIMTDKHCRQLGIGGEVLAYVW